MVPIVVGALVVLFILASIHGWFEGKAHEPIAKIIPTLDECYVRTVAEAETLGFRRAFRHVNF